MEHNLDSELLNFHGAINRLFVPAFPFAKDVVVHFTLTDGQGQYELEIAVEHDQGERELGRLALRTSLRTPMVVEERPVPMLLTVAHPGQYWIKLYANGDMIQQRGFVVILVTSEPVAT